MAFHPTPHTRTPPRGQKANTSGNSRRESQPRAEPRGKSPSQTPQDPRQAAEDRPQATNGTPTARTDRASTNAKHGANISLQRVRPSATPPAAHRPHRVSTDQPHRRALLLHIYSLFLHNYSSCLPRVAFVIFANFRTFYELPNFATFCTA